MAERRTLRRVIAAACLCLTLMSWAPSAYAESAKTKSVSVKQRMGKVFSGIASWYGKQFHGRRTASGKIFDQTKLTCAHRSLPFGTNLEVENPSTGSKCDVVVTDRGPFEGNRMIDLSKAAAQRLGITGLAHVMCKVAKSPKIASKSQTATGTDGQNINSTQPQAVGDASAKAPDTTTSE